MRRLSALYWRAWYAIQAWRLPTQAKEDLVRDALRGEEASMLDLLAATGLSVRAVTDILDRWEDAGVVARRNAGVPSKSLILYRLQTVPA